MWIYLVRSDLCQSVWDNNNNSEVSTGIVAVYTVVKTVLCCSCYLTTLTGSLVSTGMVWVYLSWDPISVECTPSWWLLKTPPNQELLNLPCQGLLNPTRQRLLNPASPKAIESHWFDGYWNPTKSRLLNLSCQCCTGTSVGLYLNASKVESRPKM